MSTGFVVGLPDMTLSRARVWSIVHAERVRLVDDLTGLPDEARLVATDCAFEFGAGDEVRGRVIDLLLAASGRIGWPTRTRGR